MTPIPLGILAASNAGPRGTGGNFIVDGNGFRHHIFTASGTFTLNQPLTITGMLQDGGLTGGNGFNFTYTGRPIPQPAAAGGSGGNSGQARYVSGPNFSGSLAVAVGGAGGASSLSTGWAAFSSYTASGAGGGFNSVFDFANGGNGENGRAHTAVSNIWSGVANIEPLTGGGGGGGASNSDTEWYVTNAGAQGASFRGAGGNGQNVFFANPDNFTIIRTDGPYSGNAGYVVLSYPIG